MKSYSCFSVGVVGAIGVKIEILGIKAELEYKIVLMLVDNLLEREKRQRLVLK